MRLPRSNFAIGLVALAVCLVGLYLGFAKAIPFKPHYEIKAAFASSNNIRPGSPVRIAGVEVGKVTKIERANPGNGPTDPRSSRCGSTSRAAPSTATRRPRSARASSSRATSSST